MKLKVIEEYFDLEQEALKEPGDILDVFEDRGQELIAAHVAEPLPEDEKPAEPAKKPAKRTAKK